MIPSVEWVEQHRLKQIRFQHLYKDFLKVKITELINKLIVDPIVEEMRRAGVSEKIYRNVIVRYVNVTEDGIHAEIYNEYYSDEGFDVALAREEGTEDHWIRPRKKQSLSWIQDGKRMSSGGHKVTGLPRLKIIPKMIERGELALQEQINAEFQKWKTTIFS